MSPGQANLADRERQNNNDIASESHTEGIIIMERDKSYRLQQQEKHERKESEIKQLQEQREVKQQLINKLQSGNNK
jgi:hypothetical protein